MEPGDGQKHSPKSKRKEMAPSQTSPSKKETFKAAFIQKIKNSQNPAEVEKFLIDKSKTIAYTDSCILFLCEAEAHFYNHYRYVLVALCISLTGKEEFAKRWGTFYEIMNQILKIPTSFRQQTQIQKHVIDFTLFLLSNNMSFFTELPETMKLMKSVEQKNNNNVQQNILSVKRIVRVFNTLLCLKFIKIHELLLFVCYFSLKSQNYGEFLKSIEEKFVKKLKQIETNSQASSVDASSSIPVCILQNYQIWNILQIFYFIDPEYKQRTLLQQQMDSNLGFSQAELKKIQSKKSNKIAVIYFGELIKFLIREIIKNRKLSISAKKQMLLECLKQTKEIDEQLYEWLIQYQMHEENPEISEVILKALEKESFREINVSRLKSILNRFNISKLLPYNQNIKKVFSILRLATWTAKKFNQPHPTYQLSLNSSVKLSNVRNAMMVVFSIDFFQTQVGRVFQFQVNKLFFDIIIKYIDNNNSCSIEVITSTEDGQQKLIEKKPVNNWSYILCMVALSQKQQVFISIDGASYSIPLKKVPNQITQMQFGPFQGSIKDIYVMNKTYEINEIYKMYFDNFRKMDLVLEKLGENKFVFTLDKSKAMQPSKSFWRKDMIMEYINVKKIRSISFSEGIQQLGGFSTLLFLVTRVVTHEKSDDLTLFLSDFFEFLKLLLSESLASQAEKSMLSSTVYFGEFLWLILNKNQYLRTQKHFFNRVLDFFGSFFRQGMIDNAQNLKMSILENIYLNFQFWSKCSYHIKVMFLKELDTRIRDATIIFELQKQKTYQKIMSSLVLFFLEDQSQEKDTDTSFFGIQKFAIHEKISKIGQIFCKLYSSQKIQFNADVIKRDISITISLIDTFFYKKHLYFSKGQLSALTVLINHYFTNFINIPVLQKSYQYQIYVISHLSKLLSKGPAQSESVFLIFELILTLIINLQNIKNKTAVLIDGLVKFREIQTLDSYFKTIVFIIRNSKAIYEPNSLFNEQQMLAVLIGSIEQKGETEVKKTDRKSRVEQSIKFESIKSEFELFSQAKLRKVLSLKQIEILLKDCLSEDDHFLSSVFFLQLIISNQIFSSTVSLLKYCIRVLLNEVKKLQRTNLTESFIVLESKAQEKTPINNSNLIEDNQQPEILLIKEVKKLNRKQTLTNFQSFLLKNDLEGLIMHCQVSELMLLLQKLNLLRLQIGNTFEIPFNIETWTNDNKNYGGDLSSYLKLNELSMKEVQILNKIVLNDKNQESIFEIKQSKSKPASQNLIFEKLIPFFGFYNCLLKLDQEQEKALNQPNLSQNIKNSFALFQIKEVLSFYNCIKVHKAFMEKTHSSIDMRKDFLLELSCRLLQEYKKQKQIETPLEKQLIELRSNLIKENWNIKCLLGMPKSLKKICLDFGDIITNFQFLIRTYSKNNFLKNQDKLDSPSLSLKKTESTFKKKKILEPLKEDQCEEYRETLRDLIKTICIRMKNESKKKEQMWKSLTEKNQFWVSSKIKNNQCYEIHPKITGFYKLNIVKTAFDQVPYPRRKSFELELQQQKQKQKPIQSQSDTKIPLDNEIMKSFLTNEDGSTLEASTKITGTSEARASRPKKTKKQIEMLKDTYYAEYVTQRGVYAGTLSFHEAENFFLFTSKGYDSLPKDKRQYQLCTVFHRIQENFKLKIPINVRSQVFVRKYIHRHTAIEIFAYHQSYFFNLFFKETRDKFMKNYASKIICVSDLRAEFEKKKYTSKWLEGRLDNFEYLMLINMYSGRTYNDLAQYPVMPWILQNYEEKQVEWGRQFLKNQSNIRDLSKPSGKLSEKKFANLKMRCNEIQQEDFESKFLYGTMYSNPTVIYNFFIRLEPFTTLHWQHQGRRIDHADRLFSAVKDQFNTVINSTSDNKQLVPQFYYWPQFLKNRNKVNLGTKQNKEEVHDVKLPGWAKSPEQFIFKMREVLESHETSKNIHQWIDLIFGYKSPNDVALAHDNLFHYRTYEHDIFETEQTEQGIKGAQITISQFGQIPYQLFLQPHKQKTLAYSDHLKLDTAVTLKKANASKKIIRLELVEEGFFIAYENEVEFYPIQNSKSTDHNFFNKPSRTYESIGGNVQLLDFVNSHWLTLKEGVFRLYDKKACTFEENLEMECYSFFGRYIIHGYRSQLVVSKIESISKISRVSSFYGHKSNICKIQVSVKLDIILSIDQNGLVLVHELEKLKFMRSFDLGVKSIITDVCIHEMGYFIFMTQDQKFIIYTFLGEQFFNQDVGINKNVVEKITKICIFEQNRSLILFGTDKGKVYEADFLQIKKFNENCVYKQFTRFKTNIFQNCTSITRNQPVKDVFLRPVPGEEILAYKVYVLFDSNQIVCFYSAEQLSQKVYKNKNITSLGLFGQKKN